MYKKIIIALIIAMLSLGSVNAGGGIKYIGEGNNKYNCWDNFNEIKKFPIYKNKIDTIYSNIGKKSFDYKRNIYPKIERLSLNYLKKINKNSNEKMFTIIGYLGCKSAEENYNFKNNNINYEKYNNFKHNFSLNYLNNSKLTIKESKDINYDYVRIQNYVGNDMIHMLDKGDYYLEIFVFDLNKGENFLEKCKKEGIEGKIINKGNNIFYRGIGMQGGDAGGKRFVACTGTENKAYYFLVTENSKNGLIAKEILNSIKVKNDINYKIKENNENYILISKIIPTSEIDTYKGYIVFDKKNNIFYSTKRAYISKINIGKTGIYFIEYGPNGNSNFIMIDKNKNEKVLFKGNPDMGDETIIIKNYELMTNKRIKIFYQKGYKYNLSKIIKINIIYFDLNCLKYRKA